MGWSEEILKRGYWEKGVFDLLNTLVANFNLVVAKLDDDATVTDTDYESLFGITSPTIGTTFGKDVQPNSFLLGDIVTLCKKLRANFNSVMDKAAADGAINGTTAYTNLKFTTTDLIDTSDARMKKLGIHQDALVEFLDNYIFNWNSFLDVLDADSGVADTDYASLYHVGDVVEASSSSSSCRSSSSSSSSSSSCSSSSSSCRSSSSSSSSSSSCRSSSSSSSSSSCRSSSSSSRSSSSSSSSSSSRSSSSSSSSSRSSSSSSSSCSSSSSSCSSSSSSRSSSSSSSSSQAIS